MEKYMRELKRAVLLGQDQDLGIKGSLSACNGYSETAGPLHAAAVGDKFAAAQQLLERGLDPNAASPHGTTPLHTAARCNSQAVAGLLIRSGANLGATDAASETPLTVAAGLGHSGIVRLLLKADDATTANLEHRDSLGNSALHLAAAGDHLEVVNLLVTWSANLLALNDSGETPLQVAERCGCRRVCDYLVPLVAEAVRSGAEAVRSGNDLVLSVLQNRVADLRAASLDRLAMRTPDRKTLLHWAAVRDAVDCAEHLHGCGILVDAADATGSSAMHYAALNRADRVCALLLRARANPDLQNASGLTPLMMCMIVDSEQVARRLVVEGAARLDLVDCECETALIHAARRGSEALTRLVVAGSSVLHRNKSGLSAVEISELNGHRKVSELLEVYRPSLDAYPRTSPKNGYCLVINQMYYSPAPQQGSDQLSIAMRSGSDCDVKKIYDLFRERLGFRVHERHDLTSDGIIQELKRTSARLSGVDYFVCFILAHGLGDAVLGTDRRLVQIKDIAQQVDAEHCRDLVGKPKIFFIQACRNRVEANIPDWRESSEPATNQPEKPPLDVSNYIDYFFGFSTWEDCLSYRCKEGSLYIQNLCGVIEKEYATTDLLKMMTHVCHEVGSTPVPGKGNACYMVPNIKCSLQKDVRF